MNKKLKKIIGEEEERGENRYTRLYKSDDTAVLERGGSPSSHIADLVRKGLAYERLEAGANDPVIRNFLRTMDEIVNLRVNEATQHLYESLCQTQLFVATLFLTFTAKLDLPLNSTSQEQLDDLHDACFVQANDMLSLIMPPPPTIPSQEDPASTALTTNP